MKFKQIDLKFVFWQEESIWSTFTGYFLYFFKSNLLFERKNPENWFQFLFWQVKSNELIWICVLTGKTSKFISICVLKQKFKSTIKQPKRTNLVSMTFHISLIFNLILTKIESKLVSYFFSSDINTLTILCGVLNWHKNCEL